MKKIFSIVTCTYNSVKFLKDNIDSIKSQSFTDYEHILIDGFSTDGTKEMVLEYQKSDPMKIKFFQLEPKGIANAMNEGTRKAQGQYIIHLHSDDYLYDKDVLADTEHFLGQKKYPDWIYSRELFVDSDKHKIMSTNRKVMFKQGYKTTFIRYLLKYYGFIRHQSVFIKKDVFERYGYFNESFRIAMDYEYWLRIKEHTRWVFFDRIVDCFRIHEGGMSNSISSRTIMQLEDMRAAKMYMNPIEFYIMRPIFRIVTMLVLSIKEQIVLYRKFAIISPTSSPPPSPSDNNQVKT